MLNTPLHQLLGLPPGNLAEQMIDVAIAQHLEESDRLDWKKHLPVEKDFKNSGIVKDIAAFANAGGGMLVFGVDETQKAASARVDAGELTESYERTIQAVSYSAIQPPVLGVRSYRIDVAGSDRLAAIVVPPSVDGPHMIFDGNKQNFSAPLRVNADTQWMNERLIEAAYRTRFEAGRRNRELLETLFEDMATSHEPRRNAVLVGVARPRVPKSARRERDRRANIAVLIGQAQRDAWYWLCQSDYHALTDVEQYAARPTLRGWIVPPRDPKSWRRAHAAIFDDGAVGLAWEGGNHRYGDGTHLPANHLPADALESFVAAVLALTRAVAEDDPRGDVELLIGIDWRPSDYTPAGDERLLFEPHQDPLRGGSCTTTLGESYHPVYRVIDPLVEENEFIRTVIDVATDCLNQAGIRHLAKLITDLPPRR